MHGYDHKSIEKKWQEKWEDANLYTTQDKVESKDNFYALVEFPYPSGNLHAGHWYAFAVMDIFVRFKRMKGANVLFPIGFDAFGLPAENAAIKRGINPREWTYSNIDYMREQLKSMGATFDWSREVITADPSYYKWTQWLFLQFFKNGLAYQKDTEVNWCPSCKTVLANEQVVSGRCERCDNEVEKRVMKQWNLRITNYADRLVEDLDSLDWPEEIKHSQRNWIGRSEGAELTFPIDGDSASIAVFTTRPDTLFGATYLVLAPEHEALAGLKEKVTNWSEVDAYRGATRKRTEIERVAEGKEKSGVELKGVSAINPGTGKKIPVWVADYVLAHYGTGAVMAVPAHDERDFEFAKKYQLPIRKVVVSPTIESVPRAPHDQATGTPTILRVESDCYSGEGELVDSGAFTGMTTHEARVKITESVGGELKTTYKLRDWTVSRQRYWGCPIPIIHCPSCGTVPVPEEELPIQLPDIDDYLPHEDGKSPLAKATEWVQVSCGACGAEAFRETDTLDTFIDSSWYFLRYTDSHNKEVFADKSKQELWMPVDFYSGGAEHTTMHLLYSRFFYKALSDFGLVTDSEPYTRRMNRGLILGPDGNKMSKSKGNVIDPDEFVERLGADTVRMYLAFIGPYNEMGYYPWNPDGIVGVRKFLERICKLSKKKFLDSAHEETEQSLHKMIKKMSDDIAILKLNTGVSQLMTFLNYVEKNGLTQNQFETLLRLLAPYAPHLSEELWHELGHGDSIHHKPWPDYDPALLTEKEVTIVVQVNGKVRGEVVVPVDTEERKVIERACALEGVQKWLSGEKPKKVVYVANRLLNLVV